LEDGAKKKTNGFGIKRVLRSRCDEALERKREALKTGVLGHTMR
jgi:hypothetical protein